MSRRFTDLVGCTLPVQLAALGGVGTTRLADAVTTAGGLGMVPGSEAVPPGSGINILIPFCPDHDTVLAAARAARVVEFFYGDPDSALVSAVHRGGALAGWQVGSVEEARSAEAAGCDYVVAQGVEAGGHVRGTTPLSELLPAVLSAVRVPIVAAGGIATARDVADVFARGADAVRVGTRFVACPESDAHADYVAAILAAGQNDTVLTEWFNAGWANAPHRVLGAALSEAQRSDWRQVAPPRHDCGRSPGDMAMYAGMGVGEVTRSEPAADVVRDLVSLLP
ncbi:MAG: NAD(P)H-dependent flavin oxidoreductase [Candidatus Dormibacteria bacterium]